MDKIIDGKREIFICDCDSLEHQYSFWYDEEDNELWFEPHLVTLPWYHRVRLAFNYVFGMKSNYGEWDSVILKVDDMSKLTEFMNKVISEDKIRERKIMRPDPVMEPKIVGSYDPSWDDKETIEDEN